jgi:hypothetical protein
MKFFLTTLLSSKFYVYESSRRHRAKLSIKMIAK